MMPKRDVDLVGSTDGSAVEKMDARRREARANLAAVPVLPAGQRPQCRRCGKELRLYRYRDINPSKVYGDYGDGLFCGLRCGYAYGIAQIRRRR